MVLDAEWIDLARSLRRGSKGFMFRGKRNDDVSYRRLSLAQSRNERAPKGIGVGREAREIR